MEKYREDLTRCQIFACKYNNNRDICCRNCERKPHCLSPCDNDPEVCGWVLPWNYERTLCEMRQVDDRHR